MSYADLIVGLQWGDEGKGKIVDHMAQKYDFVCRFAGGHNAGHTIVVDGVKVRSSSDSFRCFKPKS